MERGAELEQDFVMRPIPQIEAWFENNVWGMKEEQSEGEQNEHPRNFFSMYIYKFWEYFTLMEIITLSKAYKGSAYIAYLENIKGFADFCKMAWFNRKMDLSQFPELTLKSLRTLRIMFDVDEIIFPTNVPSGILSYLPNAKTFTFNLSREVSYIIPRYALIKRVSVTINGCFCLNLGDPTTPILLNFPLIDNLTLDDIYLTRVSLAALSTTKLKNITISQGSIAPSMNQELIDVLLKSRNGLESITIDSECNYVYEATIRCLNRNIRKFKNLYNYRPTMRLTPRNAKNLKLLAKSTSLVNVHLITNFYSKGGRSEKLIDYIRSAFAPRNILLTVEERTLADNPIRLSEWR